MIEELKKKKYPDWMDILSIIGVFFLCGVVVSLAIPSISGFWLFLAYAIQMSATIIYALALKRFRTGNFRQVLRFSIKGSNPRVMLLGVILIIALGVVMEPVINIFPKEYLQALAKTVSAGGWAMLTSIVAAPILEEVLFRGIIQDGLTQRFGAWRGILMSAFIFGAIHIIPQQVIMGTVIGIVLGYVYYKTHSILSVIVIHGINNALAQFMLLINDDITISTRELIGNDKIFFTLYGAAIVVVIWAAIRMVRSLGKIGTITEQ